MKFHARHFITLKDREKRYILFETDPIIMSSSQRPPLWLTTSLNSKHISAVLSILSDRESKRNVAQNASQMRVLERSDSSRQSPLILLGRGNREAPPSHIEHYTIAAGLQPLNLVLNRYLNIVPYDRTRVVVYDGYLDVEKDSQGRYLNASWVLERKGGKWWIATQAPVKRSAHTFLCALMQPIVNTPYSTSHRGRVRTVVQLTRDLEGGRRKADSYFPKQVGQSVVVSPDVEVQGPPLKVTLCGLRTIEEAHCIESTVSILPIVNPSNRDGNDSTSSGVAPGSEDQLFTFRHLLYLSWPDHGVPEDPQSIISFIRLVEQTNRDSSDPRIVSSGKESQEVDPDPPIIVGCSAGVGRTGSFIALASLLRGYEFLPPAVRPTPSSVLPSSPLGPLPELVQTDEVAGEIDSLREQRPKMVERPEQVLLVYEVLARAFDL